MNVVRKTRVAAALAIATVAGGLLLATPATAQEAGAGEVITIQGTCGDKFSPSVRGGKAGWTITCGGGKVRVQGWVKDTKADGKAAEIYGTWGDGASFGKPVRAGGKGKRVNFDRGHKGSHVNLYLRVI